MLAISGNIVQSAPYLLTYLLTNILLAHEKGNATLLFLKTKIHFCFVYSLTVLSIFLFSVV